MAWRMKLKLPSFKVTQRCTGSGVARSLVPRGRTNPPVQVGDENRSNSQALDSVDNAESDDDVPGLDSLWDFNEVHSKITVEPSLHEIKQKGSVQAWANIRPTITKATVECGAMHSKQCCLLCGSEALYRCIQCAPWAHYCSTCFSNVHSKVNIFHVGEIWEVRYVYNGFGCDVYTYMVLHTMSCV